MQFFKDSNYEIVAKRKVGYTMSSILIAISIISLIIHGGPKYNIDFTGGTLLHLKFEKAVKVEDLRAELSEIGFGDSEIKMGILNNLRIFSRKFGKFDEI